MNNIINNAGPDAIKLSLPLDCSAGRMLVDHKIEILSGGMGCLPSGETLAWSLHKEGPYFVARAGIVTIVSNVLIAEDPEGAERALAEAVSGVIDFLPNVRDDRSPLAFGMAPAREAESAGGMTKVPKAW